MERRLEVRSLDAIQFAQRNPRVHDIHAIMRSIRRFGFQAEPRVDAATGRLVTGHGRVLALRQMKANGEDPPDGVEVQDGDWLVPVIVCRFEGPSDIEAEAYLLADNRTHDLGGWDDAELLESLSVLQEEGFLFDVGFTDKDLDRLMRKLTSEPTPEEIALSTTIAIIIDVPEDQHQAIQEGLAEVMEAEGVATYWQALIALIDAYRSHQHCLESRAAARRIDVS